MCKTVWQLLKAALAPGDFCNGLPAQLSNVGRGIMSRDKTQLVARLQISSEQNYLVHQGQDDPSLLAS